MKALKTLAVLSTLVSLLVVPALLNGAEKAAAKGTCCERAFAQKKECSNKCCIAAHRQGKSCQKCNPNGEDLKLLKKDVKQAKK